MSACWNCNFENAEGTVICERCGALLDQTVSTTRSLDNTDFEDGSPKWGSARFNSTMLLVLDVLETEHSFAFDAEQIEEVVLGRTDPDTGERPAVDLTNSNALEKGVSRRHARIIRRDGALHIVDNDSANGTFLNGQRLIANQPRILRDGDDVRLGYLVVRVTFRAAQLLNQPE